MSPAAAELLATGFSAVHTDDLETAEAAAKALADPGDDGYDAIMAKQLAAARPTKRHRSWTRRY